jgi:His/Glu/Gln/Arg/opine family amino acid ABC transporter permease subunit
MIEFFLPEYKWVFYIVNGTLVTLQYSLLAVFFGLCLGLMLALAVLGSNFYLRFLAYSYISVIRGTPLLLQLSIVYYLLPVVTGYNISVFAAGILAFSVNSGAYVAEIIRSGIQSIDKGQFDAAKALSIPYWRMMLDIILPQALRNILPALVNEVVNMVKESALIATLGEVDIMRRAQLVAAEQYSYFAPLLVAAACYYIIIQVLSLLAMFLERKLRDNH